MQHDYPLVTYLGSQLFGKYCHCADYTVNTPTRNNISIHLLDGMSRHVQLDIRHLPDCEVLYKAFNGKHCGSATKEKLVLLLYLKTKPEQRENLLRSLLQIIHLQRLTDTPYWDAYKKEHAHITRTPEPVMPTEPFEACLMKWDLATIDKLLIAAKKVAKKKRK